MNIFSLCLASRAAKSAVMTDAAWPGYENRWWRRVPDVPQKVNAASTGTIEMCLCTRASHTQFNINKIQIFRDLSIFSFIILLLLLMKYFFLSPFDMYSNYIGSIHISTAPFETWIFSNVPIVISQRLCITTTPHACVNGECSSIDKKPGTEI